MVCSLFLLLSSNFKKSSQLLFKKFLKKLNRSQNLIKHCPFGQCKVFLLLSHFSFPLSFLTSLGAIGLGVFMG